MTERPPLIVPLSQSIEVAGEKIDKLALRHPSALDIELYGLPVKVTMVAGQVSVEFIEVKMTAMLAALAGLHPADIRKLDAPDWTAGAWALFSKFVPQE